jgi:hypothetical protein
MKRSNSGTDAWQKTVAIFKIKEWLSYYWTIGETTVMDVDVLWCLWLLFNS